MAYFFCTVNLSDMISEEERNNLQWESHYAIFQTPCTRSPRRSVTWVGLTSFGEFLWLVGRYCSYLLPKQDGGTFRIKSRSTQPNPAPRSSRSPSTSVATHPISVEIYLVHDIFIKTNFMKICMNYCTDVPAYSDTIYSNTPPTVTLLAGPKWMVY